MPQPSIPPADAPLRILIVRLSAIGDVIMASPMAQAIREALPSAHIAWAVEPLAAALVRANPYVDEVLVVDTAGTWATWLGHARKAQAGALVRAVGAFRREMRARAFDVAIDGHGLLRSGAVTWLSGAPRRIGPRQGREGSRVFVTERTPLPKSPTRLSAQYMALLRPLGIDTTPRTPILAIPDEERAAAQGFLVTRGLGPVPYVACCVSSTRPQKDWLFARWGELADVIWERFRHRTVFIAGKERQLDCDVLAELHTSRPIAAAGRLSLLQSAALVQDAAAVVGVDTGLTYAGLATDTPTVALYGSTPSGWLTEEPSVTLIHHQFPCAPCRRRPSCGARFDCMRAITAQEVADMLEPRLHRRG